MEEEEENRESMR